MKNSIIKQEQLEAMRGTEAYKTHQTLMKAAEEVQKGFLVMAKALYEIKYRGYFAELGFESLNAYLHDADLPFPATMGHALIRTYQELVMRRELPEATITKIGQTKANILARAVHEKALDEVDEKKMEGYVYLAETTPVPVFRQIMQEEKTGISQQSCKHDDLILIRCKKCYRFEYAKRSDLKRIAKILKSHP